MLLRKLREEGEVARPTCCRCPLWTTRTTPILRKALCTFVISCSRELREQNKTMIIFALLVFCYSVPSTRAISLPKLSVTRETISVSGISSGGCLATQFHVASVNGVGSFAGCPYLSYTCQPSLQPPLGWRKTKPSIQ